MLVLYYYLFHEIMYTPARDFERTSWFSDRNARFQMAEDLIDSKMLIGKDSFQLKQTLGKPELENTPDHWTYDMGAGGGGFGFLFHQLVIRFTGNEVASVEHKQWED